MNEYQFQIVDILSDDLPFNVKKDNKIVKEKRFTLTLFLSLTFLFNFFNSS